MKYPIKLDDNAILSYLWLGRIGVLNNQTFIEGVLLAPPGTIITYDLKSNKLSTYKYYELQYKAKIKDEKLATNIICYALIKSIKQVLKILPYEMKKNICIFLSGGLDSRTITYILKYQVNNLKALTFGTKKCDEIIIASHVAKKFGVEHVIEKYDLDQLANYAYETIRLSDGFDIVNAAQVVHELRMLLKNECQIFTSGFALDLTLGGSYIGGPIIRSVNELYSYILEKSSVFNHKELMSIVDSRLKYEILEVLRKFKKLVSLIPADNYLNRNDTFLLYTRVRRFTLYGSIILRNASEEILPNRIDC